MIEWYKKVVFENYANFKGRAMRSEYWYYTLASIIIAILLFTIDTFAGLTYGAGQAGVLRSLYSLLVLIPGFAVLVRRLHDVGKSGWFFLIVFIPLAGVIWLLIVLCTEGEDRTNKYGPDPKDIFFNELDEIGKE
ncbi:DUF805 domain-containing protein [Flavobacterium sp. UBA7680]|uniref:DUF805 domain-containing protein n=1 Tax=Flavobacterium sp. UBA7680 TaxID=1946559 RepID=UPI0025B8A284|nr:DUF805 domain-containing protein [Flavobacterium sp. UBA7680]